MSPLKILISIVVAIPILLVAAVMFLLSNPDYYREPLAETFKEETGLVLAINGGISWRYWPPVALRFDDADIRLEGATTPLAQVRTVAVDLDPWPLITGGQVSMRGITIDGVVLNLLIEKSGKGNWEATPQGGTPSQAAPGAPAQPPTAAESDTGGALALDIREVEITDVKLHYVDAAAGADYAIEIPSLTTGALLYGEATPTRFNLTFEDRIAAIKSVVEGDGGISFNEGFTRFDFSALHTRQQLNLPDFPVVALNLTFNGNYDVDKGEFRSDVSGQIDGEPLLGKVALTLDKRTDISADLVIERLDANRYFGGDASAAPAASSTATETPPEDSEIIPAELLRDLDFSAKIQVRSVQYATHTLTDLVVDVNNRHEQLLANTQFRAYGGDIATVVNLATGSSVSGSVDTEVAGFDVAQFIDTDWITGKATLKSHLVFAGSYLRKILGTLDGTTSFTIDDGTLDVTAIKRIAATVDQLRGKQSSVSAWPDRMPFEKLKGEHRLTAGIEANQRLSARLESMNLNGRGGIDYFGNYLNYDFEVTLDETTEGPFQISANLARIKWPLHCEGKLDANPTDLCMPDRDAVQKLITNVAKQELQTKGKEKVLEKLPDGVKEGVEKLKNLFNR